MSAAGLARSQLRTLVGTLTEDQVRAALYKLVQAGSTRAGQVIDYGIAACPP